MASAALTFCSTRTVVTPRRLIVLRRSKTSSDEPGREAGGGLVEDEDRGLDDEGAGDGEHLPLAAGQRAGATGGAGGEVGEDGVERGDALGAAGLRQDGGGELEVLVDREGGEDVLGLRDEGEAVADLLVGGGLGDVGAGEVDAAGMDRDEAGDGLDEGRLAGAVRADEDEELAGRDGEVDGADDREVALVAGGEGVGGERGGHAAAPR